MNYFFIFLSFITILKAQDFIIESKGDFNKAIIIENNTSAFYKRIEMIRSAKKTIEFETLIFDVDFSSKMVMQELMARARAGVKIRLLVDAAPGFFTFNDHYASLIMEKNPNIEIRYHNRFKLSKSLLAHRRSHRKTLIIDGKVVITGSRNIGDKYFDLHSEMNTDNREIVVESKLVEQLRPQFDFMWKHLMTSLPKKPKKPSKTISMAGNKAPFSIVPNPAHATFLREELAALNFLTPSAQEKTDFAAHMSKGKNLMQIEVQGSCPSISFVSDIPATEDHKRVSNIMNLLEKKFLAVENQEKIYLISNYFHYEKLTKRIFNHFKENNIQVYAFTNSLASSDSISSSALFYKNLNKLIDDNVHFYLHSAHRPETAPVNKRNENSKWRMNTKTYVFSPKSFFIGSPNIEVHSIKTNSEFGVLCEGNLNFTKKLVNLIEKDLKRHVEMINKDEAIDSKGQESDRYARASKGKVLKMKALTIPSTLFNYLVL